MLKAVAPALAVPAFAGEWKTYSCGKNDFRLIDERLSGKLNFSDLKDGEGGYITHSMVCPCSDGNAYFLLNNNATVFREVADVWGKDYSLIYYKEVEGKGYYILRYNHTVAERVAMAGNYTYKPAQVALNKGYPLETTVSADNIKLYVIPKDWSECAKNPIVKRNVSDLRHALELSRKLQEKYGLYTQINFNYLTQEAFEKYLESVTNI